MITFPATLDRESGEVSVICRAMVQSYNVAVGVPHLTRELEVEILSVKLAGTDNEIFTEDHENDYLRALAADRA